MSDSSDSEFDDLAAAINSIDNGAEGGDQSSEVESEKTEKAKRRKLNSAEKTDLDKFLFGDKSELIRNLEDNKLFFSDVAGNVEENQPQQSLWHDSDDEDHSKSTVGGEYKKFKRLAGSDPSWAQLGGKKEEEDSDDEGEISRKIGHIHTSQGSSKALTQGELNFKRLTNVNKATMKEGRITSVKFHPKSTVGIVAGLKGMVSIFSIDGRDNKKIHNIQYQKFPIYSCKLSTGGDELIIGGSARTFHTYNLLTGYKQETRLPKGVNNFKSFQLSPCGKYIAAIGEFGEVHLLHSVTKELLCTMKQEYQSTSIEFLVDSNKILSHSDDNEVTVFDLRTHRAEHRFEDEGCVNGTSLTVSPDGKFVATGSRQGYVNIYNYEDVFKSKRPKPKKAISNLATEITDLKFNPTTEMLAICSADAKNALKIVHLPSATVFSNFPSQGDVFGKPTVLAFSPASGFLAMGTVNGVVPLYRMRHYNTY